MARYFFDVSDGDRDVDAEGVELPSTHLAKTEAIKFAGAFVNNEPHLFDAHHSLAVTLLDEGRRPLLRVMISVTDLQPSGSEVRTII